MIAPIRAERKGFHQLIWLDWPIYLQGLEQGSLQTEEKKTDKRSSDPPSLSAEKHTSILNCFAGQLRKRKE